MITKIVSLSFRKKSLILFIFLFCLSFSGILFSNKIIGFTWDWNYPLNYQQAYERLARVFYTWNSKPTLGTPMTYTSSSLPIAVFLFSLSFLPSFIAQRVFIFLVFFIAFGGSLYLCRYLKFDRQVSLFVSLAYAFSPPMYSRLVAGHIDMIIGLALIPAIVGLTLVSLEKARAREIIFTIVLLSFASSHFLIIFNIGLFIAVTFFLTSFKSFFKKFRTILLIALGYVLVNFYWLLPLGVGLISKDFYYKGLSQIADEVNYRWQQFLRAPVSFIDVLGLKAPTGMSTEYVFPEPELVIIFKLFIYSALLILGLIYLFRYRSKLQLLFLTSYLLGGILVLGPKTPLGTFLYWILMRISPPVFFLFGNTNRFNILLVFSFIFLAGFTLNYLLKPRQLRDKILFLAFWLAVSSYPFWMGKISQPLLSGSQPLCLQEKNFSSLDELVYQEIKRDTDDSRVTLIPSGHRAYLPASLFSFPWSIWYLAKDEFYGHDAIGGNYGKFVYANLYQPEARTKNLGKFLGLAAVKRILFYDEVHYLYHSFGHWQQPPGYYETLFNPQDQSKKTLLQQEGLIKGRQIGNQLAFYFNQNYRPRITIAERAYISSGDFEVLESLFNANLAELPLVFSRQIVGQKLFNESFVFVLNHPRDYTDLFFPFLEDEEIFYPGQLVSGFYDDWTQAIHYWDRNYSLAASIDKEVIATTQTESSFSFKVATGGGSYLLLLRGLENEKAGRVELEINNQKYLVDLGATTDLGFQWRALSPGELPKGKQEIKVNSLSGENFLGPIIFLTQERYEEIEKKINGLLATSDLVMLLEAEKLIKDKDQIIVDSQASGGQAVSGGLSFNINLPRADIYQLRLRLKPPDCPEVGTVNLQNFQWQQRLVCGQNYQIENLGRINLKSGVNKLQLSLEGSVLVDQIILIKDGFFLETNWQPVSYERQNPTRYLIEAPSQTKTPYFINFAENFSSKWRLSSGQAQVRPIKSYGFSNLYYIQDGGQLILEYIDQKYLNTGLVVTLIGYLTLGLLFLWKREERL